MTYVFLGGAALLGLLAAYQYLRRSDPRLLMRSLRWMVGGGLGLLAGFLAFARRIDIAVFVAAAALSVLRTGRLGPISFEGPIGNAADVSKVRSRFFAMELNHDTGAVEGHVLSGRFAGANLIDLGEMETRALIAEIEGDPDSVGLLESWLDANRSGWREYLAETAEQGETQQTSSSDPLAEAYQVLGLKPGATDDEIKAAHRELMKAVHPDHGGSSYLAAKINEARDRLLGN